MSIIIGLIVLALVFTFFEVIVVGIVLGLLACISIILATWLAFQNYGPAIATIIFITSLILIGILLVIELKWLPKTKIGQRMFLKKSVESQSTELLGESNLIGKTGEAQTILAPSGRIVIEGKEYEAFSQDGLINAGEPVKVVGRDNFRIIIEKVKKEKN